MRDHSSAGCGGGQGDDGQALVRAGESLRDGAGLDMLDERNCLGGAPVGVLGAHAARGGRDLLVHVGTGAFVGPGDGRDDVLGRGFAGDLVADRGRADDGPGVAVASQLQGGFGDTSSVGTRLSEQDGPAGRLAGDELFGDVAVRVADDHDVDPWDLGGDQVGGILGGDVKAGGVAGVADAGVAENNNDIAADLVPQHRHPAAGGLDHVADHDALATQVQSVPHHRPRGGDAEDTDAHLLPVDQTLDDRVRLEDRHLGDVDRYDIRAEQRHPQLPLPGAQVGETVVELVVAEVDGVVAHGVERRCHRVGGTGRRDGLGLRIKRVKGRALDGVAVVDENHRLAPPLGADAFDERRRLRQADLEDGVRAIRVVVPVEGVAVHIARSQHSEGAHLRLLPDEKRLVLPRPDIAPAGIRQPPTTAHH